jgi:hypothetical protein
MRKESEQAILDPHSAEMKVKASGRGMKGIFEMSLRCAVPLLQLKFK